MITHLLIKPVHKRLLQSVERISVTAIGGIAGQVKTPPLRQVLLLDARTLRDFDLQPGDLRENMIVDGLDLDEMPSGTVLESNGVRIALTFLCEPCRIIADKVNVKDIHGRRGYLGRFLNDGVLRAGDAVRVTDEHAETISEQPAARIKWVLDRTDSPLTASALMWQAGLATSYCRALPALLRKHPEIDKDKIKFAKIEK